MGLEKYKVELPDGELGKWTIERFTVDPNSIHALRAMLDGRPVQEGTYTRLMRGSALVMSDTPAEILDHLEFIRRETGRVLINGLGIGMCLKAVLAKPEVTHVDVVEIDTDLIRLVSPHYACERLSIYNHDAFTMEWSKGKRWDTAWHDVWDNICADNLEDMKRLHRKYGRRAAWQGSWCRARCEYEERRWKKERERFAWR